MTKYTKRLADLFLCPKNPQSNFLNDTGGAIQAYAQADLIPYCFIKGDVPLILPKPQDEGSSGIGEGRNETVVLENQYEIGAGSLVNQAINFLTIPRIGGSVVTTYTATEIFTILCVADVDKSLQNKYFEFDIQLAANTIKKYFVWFNVNAEGVAPTPDVPYGGARTAVEIAVATNATAATIATAVKNAIDALTDVGAAVVTTTVTVTLDNAGGVDDAHDVDSGITATVTTQGLTKVVITFDAETLDNQNYGFHFQEDNGAYDIIYDLTGISIAEHTLECEHDGMLEEDVSFMVAGLKDQYGALTMLDKMRNPFGVQWTKGLSPYGNKKEVKNHHWGTINKNFTFTYNGTPFVLTWFGFKIKIGNELSHDRDGGGDYASGVNFNKRETVITVHVQPEDHYLYQTSKLHYLSYAGDILLQIKSIQPGDANIYVQFDCDKLRTLPFEEEIKADGSPNEQDIDLIPAPGATFLYTLQGYLSNEYFGGHQA